MADRRWVAADFGGREVLKQVDAEVPVPGPGEVTIEVRAVGMNPADFKRFAAGDDRSVLPMPVGYEVAGVIRAIGPDTEIGSGGGAVGDEVLAFRISGGYATAVTVPADKVFAKPPSLDFPAAANLLLAGTTAADMLHVTNVAAGETILVHGASGAVGVSVLQQAKLLGSRAVGTASEKNFDTVRRFGGVPVAYGDGLLDRVREAAPEGIAAALDTVGTDEAVDVSPGARAPRADRHDRRAGAGERRRLPRDRRRGPGQRGLPRPGAPAADPAGRRRRPRRPRRADVPVRRGPGRAGAAPLRPPGRQARSDPLTSPARTRRSGTP